jgi:adenosylmethionine-8-amino-7-oxononanoate aminotransferase
MSVDELALTIVSGNRATLWDDAGRAYLDATAGLWYCNVGHGRTEIAEAVAGQMRGLAVYHTYDFVTNEPVTTLAERLLELLQMPGARVFFTPGGGSDAIETAAKLARAYWRAAGQPARRVFVARTNAYHGMNAFGTSICGMPLIVGDSGPFVPDIERIPWDDSGALREIIKRVGDERVAAFFCEPVIGAGGVLHPPSGYLADVQRICQETGALFVVDEVMTGFGRLGEWFACHRFGLEPDLVILAKGLTSGYFPLGAVVVGERVAEPFWREGTTEVFRHGYTYSGHPSAAAAALANLSIIEREDLVERVRTLEPTLAALLKPLADHPLVREVRAGIGLAAAVEIDPPEMLPELVGELRQHGVLARGLPSGGALQISPPFVVTPLELESIATGIAESLDACLFRRKRTGVQGPPRAGDEKPTPFDTAG